MTEGPIRRERVIEGITNTFTRDYQLDKRTRAILMGAIRIGMIEATLSPSVRQAIEAWWGLEGTERLANAPEK